MATNYEIVEKKFMPVFKARAAALMHSGYKITQSKSAQMLGVTQAAISKYLKNHARFENSNIIIDEQKIKEFIEYMIKQNEHDAQKLICKMCQDNIKFDCGLMIK